MRRASVLVGSVIVFALCTPAVAAPPNKTPRGFVRANGPGLVLDGQPYRFAGLNIYNANSDGTCGFEHTTTSFRSALQQIGTGQNAVRAWFFQSLTTAQGGKKRDWTRFDRTLAEAGAVGAKVIVTLGNQWADCEKWPTYEGGYKTRSWYETGYKTSPGSPGMPSTYRRWVADVVKRYRMNPNVLMWQLINEAEAKESLNGDCDEDTTASAALKSFATDMAGVVKSIDPNHLLSLGTIGSGQCGASSLHYKDLHSVPGIDVCEAHDYTHATTPLPGDESNGLALRFQQCGELGKPLFVGETGIKPSEIPGDLQDRANLLRDKFAAQVGAGSVGEMVWAWSPFDPPASKLDDYDIGPGDPALAELAAVWGGP